MLVFIALALGVLGGLAVLLNKKTTVKFEEDKTVAAKARDASGSIPTPRLSKPRIPRATPSAKGVRHSSLISEDVLPTDTSLNPTSRRVRSKRKPLNPPNAYLEA